MSHPALSVMALWRYGALAAPVAFAGFPLYVLAPDYYATQHGVSLALLGVLLLALRLFDALQDPLIGALSDRHRQATPAVMAAASLALCAAIFGLFNLTPFSPALWFALCMAVAVSAYSVLSINLNALGALWTTDTHELTRIHSMREACGLAGLLLAVSLPSALMAYVAGERVYMWFSLILCGLMATAWLVFAPWLRAHPGALQNPPAAPGPLRQSFGTLSHDARLFLGVYGLSMLASAVPAVLVMFFVRDLLQAPQLTGLFLLLYFLSGALAMPLWKTLSRHHGKYGAWLAAMLLAVAGFVGAFFLEAGNVWAYAAICIASGLALGADLALPPAILADRLHATGAPQHAAAHYSLLTLVAKLSLALAGAIALPLLDQAGFVPQAQNTASALLALSVAYALIPCLLKLAAALLLWRCFIHPHQGEHHAHAETGSHRGSTHHA